MSSIDKTENLELNQWCHLDYPEMMDFNNDNMILDTVISRHHNDGDVHVTTADKERWSTPHHIQVFYGDGSSSRNIVANTDYTPSWGIVFSISLPPGVTDFGSNSHYNYFGIFSGNGSMPGLTLNGKTLKLTQSTSAVSGSEYRSYNQNGIAYAIIFFR